MSDYIVRATAADANIRAFAVTAKEMVETAREHHKTTPVMTAKTWTPSLWRSNDGIDDER